MMGQKINYSLFINNKGDWILSGLLFLFMSLYY
jgi:hypothetical protein